MPTAAEGRELLAQVKPQLDAGESMLDWLHGSYQSQVGLQYPKSYSGILLISELRLVFFSHLFEDGRFQPYSYEEAFSCTDIHVLRNRREGERHRISFRASPTMSSIHEPEWRTWDGLPEWAVADVDFWPYEDQGELDDDEAAADFLRVLQTRRGSGPVNVHERLYDLHDRGVLSEADIAAPQARLQGLAWAHVFGQMTPEQREKRTKSWHPVLDALDELAGRLEAGALTITEYEAEKRILLKRLRTKKKKK